MAALVSTIAFPSTVRERACCGLAVKDALEPMERFCNVSGTPELAAAPLLMESWGVCVRESSGVLVPDAPPLSRESWPTGAELLWRKIVPAPPGIRTPAPPWAEKIPVKMLEL